MYNYCVPVKILIIFIALFPCEIYGVNTCTTWKGYFTNKSCQENTDDTLDVPGQINKWGFQTEQFDVVTEDKYVLTTFRVFPKNSNGKTVLITHGIGMNSHGFTNRREKSLAFQFLTAGFTVWLANFRGSKYSRKHLVLKDTDPEFFNYSFVEMGTRDLPAILETVAQKTQNFSKIYYVGFSMGTTAGFVLNTEKPETANKYVKVFVNMAPVAFLAHTKTPLKLLTPFWKLIEPLVKLFSGGEIMKPTQTNTEMQKKICLNNAISLRACDASKFVLFGPDFQQQDPLYLPVTFLQNRDSISVKLLTHYIQLILSHKFRNYDYGSVKNTQMYGSPKPPSFNLSKVCVKQKSFVGPNDYLAVLKDVEKLHSLLPTGISEGIVEIDYKKFAHGDFIAGKDNVDLLYQHVVNYLVNFK